MTPEDLLDAPVAALTGAVSSGAARPEAVAEAALDRLKARNHLIGAVVDHDPLAVRAEAEAVSARLARGAHLPLAGAPLLVKDNIFVRGRRITQGARLFAEHRPDRDAIAVARARAAGAVILGISACSEFACKGVTTTPLHGPTRNPWDLDRTPGGSSGGAAAALAAGLVPLALGTDAGGSGRRPAAHCAVVGFKPSWGAIPYGPGFAEPFWDISVIAPMARRAADAAVLFDALAGAALADPASQIALAPARPPETLRIAVAPTLGRPFAIDADAAEATARAADALADAGFRMRAAAPDWRAAGVAAGEPDDADLEGALMALQHAGLAALYGGRWRAAPDLFDPDLGAQIDRGLSLGAADVVAALETARRIRETMAAFFEEADLLLCATTPCPAWPLHRLGPERIGDAPAGPRDHAALTPHANVARIPAISIPCGRAENGLPLGVQLLGAAGQDRSVLAAAIAAERIFIERGLAPGAPPIAGGTPT